MRSGFRQLTLNKGTWQYKVGKQYTLIFSPSGVRICVSNGEINGVTPDEFARVRHKGCDSGRITPDAVRAFIENVYLNSLDQKGGTV